jgi:TetR/AcrR family transcriptional regulator
VAEKTRDADRSRRAILIAATRLFAERGYDATSLADVGAAAGLSRQAPAYFFGSKDELYAAVLQELFAERERELVPAFAPLHRWAKGDDDRPLKNVLGDAVDAYLDFLQSHPEFVSLTQREAVAGGTRLTSTPHRSSVMEDAFEALRKAARRRGLRSFDPREVVIAFLGLTYFPTAHKDTLLPALHTSENRRARRRQTVDVLLHLVERQPR